MTKLLAAQQAAMSAPEDENPLYEQGGGSIRPTSSIPTESGDVGTWGEPFHLLKAYYHNTAMHMTFG